MWNKLYPVMWVSIKSKEKRAFSFSFPVPLKLLDELIGSTLDLLEVISWFTFKGSTPKITSGEKKVYFSPEALKILLEGSYSILHSLGDYGPYELVDVTTGDVQVFVKIL
ncbi:hypothetical protein [Anaerocolumna xylanovorans]|uniref:Uncharacterized protein n=1 Tax=Anaerocolumna xylanovorans DSM 12503 TaxID=1121345 RepID=A0A1M7XWX5_9FIRM|nr:hypothetical protein [Anaerocolumna xylanovorans]SHO43344.1 hypothetical protein SAMN02745217_00194 [Anaerocolumna xylanovorans DSM 12503]